MALSAETFLSLFEGLPVTVTVVPVSRDGMKARSAAEGVRIYRAVTTAFASSKLEGWKLESSKGAHVYFKPCCPDGSPDPRFIFVDLDAEKGNISLPPVMSRCPFAIVSTSARNMHAWSQALHSSIDQDFCLHGNGNFPVLGKIREGSEKLRAESGCDLQNTCDLRVAATCKIPAT